MSEVKRPAIRYHGAKFRIAPWVLQHFPPHTCYVEPFGGAAGVLLQKPRAYAEVYNDLDGDVVNFFRVLRDPEQRRELIEACALTPYARDEFDLAWKPTDSPVEQARRLAVRIGRRDKGDDGFSHRHEAGVRHGAADMAALPGEPGAGGRAFSGCADRKPAGDRCAAGARCAGHASLRRPALCPRDALPHQWQGWAWLPARDERRGPCRAAAGARWSRRHGGAERLRHGAVSGRAGGGAGR